jgi:hypothetical protein
VVPAAADLGQHAELTGHRDVWGPDEHVRKTVQTVKHVIARLTWDLLDLQRVWSRASCTRPFTRPKWGRGGPVSSQKEAASSHAEATCFVCFVWRLN